MAAFFSLISKRPVAAAWLTLGAAPMATAAGDRATRAPAAFRTYANERPLRIELLDWEEARRRIDDWADLTHRCLEPNVFLEPSFALANAQHSPVARRPVFLFVYDTTGTTEAGRLIGLCALSRSGRQFGTIARASCPKLAALGTPLLDNEHGAEAFELMLAWFARNAPGTTGVLFPALPSDGPTARLIRSRAQALGIGTRSFGVHSRAILPKGGDCDAMWRDTIPSKRMKELRRQHRRLGEAGKLQWVSARDPKAVRAAFERFLALEAGGWKGQKGTALLSDPSDATFARSMTRILARPGQCRIDALELDGRPIAMGITLISGRTAALWKIAYDEDFASYSPGVQFTLEYTRRQLAEGSVDQTDSCAIPDHPMIDRIWPERMSVEDLFIATAPVQSGGFRKSGDREALRRRAYVFAKSAWHSAQKGKRSLAQAVAGVRGR